MPRKQARTHTSIWSNRDFLALSKDAQRMYWLLYSQPTITLVGVQALTVKRWAATARDETVEGVIAALAELEHADFIAVDPVTEEVLVRTFARHDGMKPKASIWHIAWGLLDQIMSVRLREKAEVELASLGEPADIPVENREKLSTARLFPVGGYQQPVENDGGSTKVQGNTLSGTLPPYPPPLPSRGGDAGARAPSSVVSPLSPSTRTVPGPSPLPAIALNGQPAVTPNPETGTVLRTDDPETTGSATRLGHRLASTVTADNRARALTESHMVISWAIRYVDTRIIDEAIHWAETRPDGHRLALPRALAPTIRAKAKDHGIPMPPFEPER